MGCCNAKGVGYTGYEDSAAPPREFRESLVYDRFDDVFHSYEVVRELDKGSMGTISIVRRISAYKDAGHGSIPEAHLDRNRLYAMKTILASRVTNAMMQEMRNEVEILRTLDHPNIIQLHEVFHVKRGIHVIMELCEGGNLGGRVFPELQTAEILRQVLRALAYMHDRQICHRDLKLENIMFLTLEPESTIKLIDFGLSKTYARGEKLRLACGTMYSMAPEVLGTNGYTQQADMWSVGIIAYALLSGNVPFLVTESELADEQKKQRFMQARYAFISPIWSTVTPQARQFIGSLLRRRPESRLSAKEALRFVEEEWIPAAGQEAGTTLRQQGGGVNHDLLSSMQRFATYGKFKKALLMVLAFTMEKHKLKQLSDTFVSLDTEKNGVLNFAELKAGLAQYGIPEEQLREMFSAVDMDKSGKLHYLEFLAATLEARGFLEEEKLAEAFERVDTDNTGTISKKNLRAILGTTFDAATVDEMVKEVSSSRNGMINYNDFLAVMQPRLSSNFALDAYAEPKPPSPRSKPPEVRSA